MGKALKIAVGGLAGLVFLAVIVAAVAAHAVHARDRRDEARYRADVARFGPKFEADLEAAVPVGAPPPGAHGDAGVLFNPKLRWLGTGPRRLGKQAASPPFVVPAALHRRLHAKDWPKLAPKAWQGLDLSWMDGLSAYAYWDLERTGPITTLPHPLDDPGAFAARPIPYFITLDDLCRVRLLQGLHDQDLGAAVRQVRQVVRLLLSTESLIAVGVAASIVDDEARARAAWRAEGRAPPAGLTPWTHADGERLLRVAFGATAFVRLDTPPGDAHALAHAGWVACTALDEWAWGPLGLRPLLAARHRAAYAHLDRLLAEHPDCRLDSLRRFHHRALTPSEVQVFACEGLGIPRRACIWMPFGQQIGDEVLAAMRRAFGSPFVRYRMDARRAAAKARGHG